MTRQMGKRIISLFCVWIALTICGAMRPLSALADSVQATGVDFQLKTSLDPYALDQAPDRFIKSTKNVLDSLDLSGHMVLKNGQADITGNLFLNGLSAIDFHLTGWEERVSLATSLFGEKPVVLTMPNYIPFLMKMYHYFDIPVQYVGVFTDPYSYLHGIKPMLEKWSELVGGTGSRAYSPEECIEKAVQFSQMVDENPALNAWLKGLLQHAGLDELLFEFMYALPDWTASLVEKGGLQIQVSDTGESWTLGGETVYTLKREGKKTAWQVDLPEWEGFRLFGLCELEERESGLQLSMDWKLFENGKLYAYLSLAGQDLPDGKQMRGNGTITVSLGAEALGSDQSLTVGLRWDQRQESGKTMLDGQVTWLHPDTGRAILAVDAKVSWGSTQESFQPRKTKDIRGIDFFCMNDTTLQEFYANSKWPMIRTAIPFLVELPAGFLSGVVEWMDKNGMLLTLMDGLVP